MRTFVSISFEAKKGQQVFLGHDSNLIGHELENAAWSVFGQRFRRNTAVKIFLRRNIILDEVIISDKFLRDSQLVKTRKCLVNFADGPKVGRVIDLASGPRSIILIG